MSAPSSNPVRHPGLVVVATPIGNLGDLPPRAVAELSNASLVVCEDTRRTGRLFEAIGVAPPRLWRLDEHTEVERSTAVLDRIVERGDRVVLISDAGTPGVADPGRRLVDAAHRAGVAVAVVPGPSAVVTALAVSGLRADRFVFEGFVARKGAQRTQALEEISVEARTVVLYEAPHRMERTLTDLVEHCGAERRVVICRELTKLHEEIWRGELGEAARAAAERVPRGEHVLVIEGAAPPPPPDDRALIDALEALLGEGGSTRDAVDRVSRTYGVARRRVYALVPGHAGPNTLGPTNG